MKGLELFSFNWWASAVVAGFLLSLVASYVRSALDFIARRFSKRARERSAREQERRELVIQYLARSEDFRVKYLLSTARHMFRAIYLMLFAITGTLFIVLGFIVRLPAPAPGSGVAGKILDLGLPRLCLVLAGFVTMVMAGKSRSADRGLGELLEALRRKEASQSEDTDGLD